VSASEPTEPDNLPALVVTFGTTARKRRVLEKSTSLLGRGKGCDIRLDSVEISTVHCVITHTACGLAIRDCDSRVGTLVNDQPVKEGTLSHGDVLQLGPFSFRVHIPKGWPPTLPALMRTSDSQTTGSTELGSNTGVPAEQLADVAERIFAVEERERELARTRQELEKQAAALEEQKRQLHAERHADLDHLATYKSEIEALKHSYTEQAAQLEEARAARERMTAEHEALMYPLREQNLAIQARLDQAYSELDSLRSSVMQTRMDLPEDELGEQGTVLRHQLSQQQQVIESLERELHEARTVVQVEQQARLDSLQQELAQVRQELAENRQHRERLEQELATATPRAEDTLATEIEQLRAQLAESQ
jgi:pSer/pThr/pTyr-binding forkhead associated (FHA) protein